MPEWTFEWLTSADIIGDADLRTWWEALLPSSPDATVFNEPTVVESWLTTKGRAMGARPVYCRGESTDAGCLITFGQFPSSWRNGFERRLTGVGEPHFDYQHPVLQAADGRRPDWDGFWSAFRNEVQRNIRWFDRLTILRLAENVASRDSVPDSWDCAPYIDLRPYDTFESYLQSRPSGHRTDVRRQFRRLSEKGPIELYVYGTTETDDAKAELVRMVQAYGKIWATPNQRHLFERPGTLEFYRCLIARLLPTGMLHFSVVRVGGVAASWHFGFLHRKKLYYYKPTYEVAFAKQSPGKVHLALLIQQGLLDGWHVIDMGGGTEPYKFLWTEDVLPLRQVQWRTATIRSNFCKLTRRILRRG